MKRTFELVLVLVLVFGLSQVVMAGGGSKKPKSETPSTQQISPEEEARQAYNIGIASRDKAWKIEKELAAATEAKSQEKLSRKLEKSFRSAATSFERAVGKNPMMFEAHSDLGYCLRKLGDYQGSLTAYNRALEIEPRYAEAIEYRAEAYLGLDRIDEAKQAYMDLFKGQNAHASALLEAMQNWVAERSDDPGSADPADVQSFSSWVAERAEIAGQTKSVSQLNDADW